jgi:hypothetical protein
MTMDLNGHAAELVILWSAIAQGVISSDNTITGWVSGAVQCETVTD